MVYNTTHNSPQPHCLYTLYIWFGKGGRSERRQRGNSTSSFVRGGKSSQAGLKVPTMSECISSLEKPVKHNVAKSINRSILKKSRHLGFSVFIVHSSMVEGMHYHLSGMHSVFACKFQIGFKRLLPSLFFKTQHQKKPDAWLKLELFCIIVSLPKRTLTKQNCSCIVYCTPLEKVNRRIFYNFFNFRSLFNPSCIRETKMPIDDQGYN